MGRASAEVCRRYGEKAGGDKPGHKPKANETKRPDSLGLQIVIHMIVVTQMNHVPILQEETAGQFEA